MDSETEKAFYGRVIFSRTKRLPFGPAGIVALICWVVPLSLMMMLVTPTVLQAPVSVSLHSTVKVLLRQLNG